jgi:hypothetical protein
VDPCSNSSNRWMHPGTPQTGIIIIVIMKKSILLQIMLACPSYMSLTIIQRFDFSGFV